MRSSAHEAESVQSSFTDDWLALVRRTRALPCRTYCPGDCGWDPSDPDDPCEVKS